jgi:hypothetical protein
MELPSCRDSGRRFSFFVGVDEALARGTSVARAERSSDWPASCRPGRRILEELIS